MDQKWYDSVAFCRLTISKKLSAVSFSPKSDLESGKWNFNGISKEFAYFEIFSIHNINFLNKFIFSITYIPNISVSELEVS